MCLAHPLSHNPFTTPWDQVIPMRNFLILVRNRTHYQQLCRIDGKSGSAVPSFWFLYYQQPYSGPNICLRRVRGGWSHLFRLVSDRSHIKSNPKWKRSYWTTSSPDSWRCIRPAGVIRKSPIREEQCSLGQLDSRYAKPVYYFLLQVLSLNSQQRAMATSLFPTPPNDMVLSPVLALTKEQIVTLCLCITNYTAW